MVWSFWLTMTALLLWSPLIAFTVVFLLGVGKECWDEWYGSGFCMFDLAGNCLGSFIALGCGLLTSALFF